MADENLIYRFSDEETDGNGDMVAILGGKGAGLARMCKMGLPIPPGFTIPTTVCKAFATWPKDHPADKLSLKTYRDNLIGCAMKEWAHIGKQVYIGDQFPLVSVRSGAPISMPGMMDTILNVGLTTSSLPFWKKQIGERAALDSYRRLIHMMGVSAFDIPAEEFNKALNDLKYAYGVSHDFELKPAQLFDLIQSYKEIFAHWAQTPFPATPTAQLDMAILAVFKSWTSPRAVEYRKINKIDPNMGTACTVQAMVFGNVGDNSGTGVLFSWNPLTGAKQVMGEFLQNAQGEDVVAGIRTPVGLVEMQKINNSWAKVYNELMNLTSEIEHDYRDMVDIEFTVQHGKLYILQSRVGKRSAIAAFNIAAAMYNKGTISKAEALGRLTVEQFKAVRRPTVDPTFKTAPLLIGIPACPGVVTGRPVFSSEEAVAASDKVVLVTVETTPDDIAGMDRAQGILTKIGGATSHAAVVARAMDKACIVGATDLNMEAVKQAKSITLDGSTGRVWLDITVPMIDNGSSNAVKEIVAHCCDVMGVVDPLDANAIEEMKPMTIMAARYWEDMATLDTILARLEKLPSRQHVRFEIKSPHEYMLPEDQCLFDAFGIAGGNNDTATIEILAGKLLPKMAKGGPLHGLVLTGYQGHELGQAVASTVPSEYAAFTVLKR